MNSAAEKGTVSFCSSIFLGILSWLTPDTLDTIFKFVTTAGAVVSTIFAARYYYYAAKEKKDILKKSEKKE